MKIPEDGAYQLSMIYRGVDTTGVSIQMVIQAMDERDTLIQEYRIYPVDWFKKYQAPSLKLKANQKIRVGLRIQAPPIYGMLKGFVFKKI